MTPIFFDGILFSAIKNHGMWGQIRQNNKEKNFARVFRLHQVNLLAQKIYELESHEEEEEEEEEDLSSSSPRVKSSF